MGTVKNIFGLRTAAIMLSLIVALMGCTKEPVTGNEPVPEGLVPLKLNLSGMYGHLQTKASSNGDLASMTPKLLAENSTLRLLVLKNTPSGPNELVKKEDLVENSKYSDELGFVYMLKADKFGNVYPQPCERQKYDNGDYMKDDDGNYIYTPSSIPYYLPVSDNEVGTDYYCMAISPAKPLHEDSDGIIKVAVNNKEDILASNNMWDQTMYNAFKVTNKVTEEAVAELNPLMYSTAKIRIKVVNGENVTSLYPGNPFIGFDRVPTNPGASWTGDEDDEEDQSSQDDDSDTPGKQHRMPDFNLPIGGEIETQMGNNILYNRMFVSEFDMVEETSGKVKDIEVTTETNLLPMDCRPTPMIIKLNIYVNETPMQFQFQTGKVFKPGHVYDYIATIKLAPGNIFIASWQDVSWSWPLKPLAD